jgi:hypothetical protein
MQFRHVCRGLGNLFANTEQITARLPGHLREGRRYAYLTKEKKRPESAIGKGGE